MYKRLTGGLNLLRNIAGIRLGYPSPIIAVWETTYRCNMKCHFCNEKNLVVDEMDTRQAVNMIRQLDKLNTNVILLTGGEPTIREDIDTIMDSIRKSGMTSIFTTNGQSIKRHLKTLLKADLIRVSVDGYGEVHDKVRETPGAFAKIEEGVPLLVEAGKPPMLVCVVTSLANRENLRQLFQQAREWKVQIDFSMVTYSLRTEKVSGTSKKISEIQEECRIHEKDFLDMLYEFQKDYPDVLANPKFYKHLILSGGLGKRCKALDVSLNIRPNGRASIPCDAFALFELDGPMQEVWSKMQGYDEIKSKLGEYEFCHSCYKRCIAFPSMLIDFRNLIDLAASYFPTMKR